MIAYKDEWEWLKSNVSNYFRLKEEDTVKMQFAMHMVITEMAEWRVEEMDEMPDIGAVYVEQLDKALETENYQLAALIAESAQYFGYEI